MVKKVKVGDITIGEGRFVLVAGPCVLESLEMALEVAAEVKNMCDDLGLAYIFKSSFDKANRTSIHSFRGPGLDVGLGWLEQVKSRLGVPVLTDIHEPNQAELAARVVDVIQIPAFCADRPICSYPPPKLAAAQHKEGSIYEPTIYVLCLKRRGSGQR